MRKRYVPGQRYPRAFWIFMLVGILLAAALWLGGVQGSKEQRPLQMEIILGEKKRDVAMMDYSFQFYNPKTKEVETMGIEEYVVGVVAAEMPASYEPEALKAQAVAARTLAVYKVEQRGCGKYGGDICGHSSHCQAWNDDAAMRNKWGQQYEAYLAKIMEAVADTAGEIITYNGKAIEVLYHSTSGGVTEDVENVFANALPYLRSVESIGEEDTSHFISTTTMSTQEFYGVLKKKYEGVSTDKGVSILSTYESGRVKEVNIGGIVLSGKETRTLYNLKSTLFTIDCSKDKVVIKTRGFGHGVGMSQVGANAMAQKGNTYETILAHYYTDIEIKETYGR